MGLVVSVPVFELLMEAVDLVEPCVGMESAALNGEGFFGTQESQVWQPLV